MTVRIACDGSRRAKIITTGQCPVTILFHCCVAPSCPLDSDFSRCRSVDDVVSVAIEIAASIPVERSEPMPRGSLCVRACAIGRNQDKDRFVRHVYCTSGEPFRNRATNRFNPDCTGSSQYRFAEDFAGPTA
jgi:hypothetical protein